MRTTLKTYLKLKIGWASVAHACNPSYSRDGNQEDHSSKTLSKKIPNTKQDWCSGSSTKEPA
jgi:hypothetical protein